MDPLTQAFEERLAEIEAYLDFLEGVEIQVRVGPPRLSGGRIITPQQQKILYSCVYLQLYNLVEATITRCVEAVSTATTDGGLWKPDDLIDELRREWVRFVARTHTELSFEHRLQSAMQLCDHLTQALPVSPFKIAQGGGGNWDDVAISRISDRIGLPLRVSAVVDSDIKRHFRNSQGALVFVRSLRNALAHGNLSFEECGEGVTVSDLQDLKNRAASYLREVVAFFKSSIDSFEYLRADRRPKVATP